MIQLLILSLFVISGYCQNFRPTVTLYNNNEEVLATYIYKFHADVPKLDFLPYQNGFKICRNGIWLAYYEENYTPNAYAQIHLDECYKSSPNGSLAYGSLRVIGDPANFSTPALTLFTKTDFSNDDNTVPPALKLEDEPDLGGLYASFILNGDQPITLYSGINFGGMKLCVLPNQVKEIATIVANVQVDLGITPDMIKSFKFGCHSKNIAKTKNDLPIIGSEDELIHPTL